MTDHILFTFPAAKAFASGKIKKCEMWVERFADQWIATSSSMFATEWPGFHKFSRDPLLRIFFTGSPASDWTRNFRPDYVELWRTTSQSSSDRYFYGRLQLLRGHVGRYQKTNLDAGVYPAGEKIGSGFGYLLLALGPARSWPVSMLISSMTHRRDRSRDLDRDPAGSFLYLNVWEKKPAVLELAFLASNRHFLSRIPYLEPKWDGFRDFSCWDTSGPRDLFLSQYMGEKSRCAWTGIASVCPQLQITDPLPRVQMRCIPRF